MSWDIGRRMRDAEILLHMMAGSGQHNELLREEARNYFRRYGENPLPVLDVGAKYEEARIAAKAVVDRFDSPSWEDRRITAKYINELRRAIEK